MATTFEVLEVVDFVWLKASSYTFPEPDAQDVFCAPRDGAEFEPLSLQELYSPDRGDPVHQELLDLDGNDLDGVLDFVKKWGFLGTAFSFDRIRVARNKTTQDRQERLTFADVEVLPNELGSIAGKPTDFVPGSSYFEPFLTRPPSQVEIPQKWFNHETTEDPIYNPLSFRGWSYYGEWLSLPNDMNLENPDQLVKWLGKTRYALSFPNGVRSLQAPFELMDSFGDKDLGMDSLPSRIFHSGISMKVMRGEKSELKFHPRTLLDYCKLAVALDGLQKCLNCNRAVKNKYCDHKCREQLKDRQQFQGEDFKKWLEKHVPSLASDWPDNNHGNPFHPALLLEQNPLDKDRPRTLSQEEKQQARLWATEYKNSKSRATKKRGDFDLLLDVFLESGPEKDPSPTGD